MIITRPPDGDRADIRLNCPPPLPAPAPPNPLQYMRPSRKNKPFVLGGANAAKHSRLVTVVETLLHFSRNAPILNEVMPPGSSVSGMCGKPAHGEHYSAGVHQSSGRKHVPFYFIFFFLSQIDIFILGNRELNRLCEWPILAALT